MRRKVAPRKKVTFSLGSDVLREMKELVQAEKTGSQNRFVEEALEEHIKRLRREMLRQEFERASRDPLFLSDVKRVEKDFKRADEESLRLIA